MRTISRTDGEDADDDQSSMRKRESVKKSAGNGEDGESSSMDSDEISIHFTCKIENSDDLLKICGDGGVWQIFIFLLGSSFGFHNCIQGLLYLFITLAPNHWCSYPEVDKHLYTDGDLKKMLIPMFDTHTGMYEKCLRYKSQIFNGSIVVDRSKTEECNVGSIPVQYEQEHFAETIGSEWNLVCKDKIWGPLVEEIYIIGNICGLFVFGMLSDKLGRRRSLWISTFILVTCSPVVATSTNFLTLQVFRFMVGFAAPGVKMISNVLVLESFGSEYRGLAGSLYTIPYSIGYMFLPIIAYFVRDWRNLQLICASLTFGAIIVWWNLPESPRWLLIKGKVDEAEKLFRKIAKVNGKPLPNDFHYVVKKIAHAEKERKNLKTCDQRCRGFLFVLSQTFRTHIIRARVFIITFAFTVTSLVYYGIAMSPIYMHFDKYLFTFVCGLLEIPTEILMATQIERMGRKLIFCGFFFAVGFFLLISLLLPTDSILTFVFFVTAQLFIIGNSGLIVLYASELFPTEIRGFCLGISSMIGKVGTLCVPFINELLGEEHRWYPTIIFGSSAILAGFLALLLPETKNKRLPETVAEFEK